LDFYPFLPVVAVALLTAFFWRVEPAFRLAWAVVGMVTLVCCVGDRILFTRLPQLGLSFGPVNPPFFMMNFMRMIPFILILAVITLARQPWQRTVLVAALSAFQLGFFTLAYTGLYREPFRLGVTDVPITDAPAFFPDRPLRILQLSDLHIEHISPREREMMERIKNLHPDIIVLTGDYMNKSYLDDPVALAEARELLSQLQAPFGVYAINGNVDTPTELSALFDGLKNIHWMQNEIVPLDFPGGTLNLVGVNTVDHEQDYVLIEHLMATLPLNGYSLLLYHYPERVDIASAFGVDLYLAGDTHGGQVRLPWIGTMTGSRYNNHYIMGRYRVGPTTLYVSRGLGMQGSIWPRLRLNCPPEMVLVNLGK
jgi:uncharacterized protein